MVQTTPAIGLLAHGPRINVTVGIADFMAVQLTQQGLPVPAPISGLALIDTGASGSCIDDALAQRLGLPVVDIVAVATPSHTAAQANVYPALIEILGVNIRLNVPRATGSLLSNQGIIALLGRDFLQHCTLHYNGLAGNFTLSA